MRFTTQLSSAPLFVKLIVLCGPILVLITALLIQFQQQREIYNREVDEASVQIEARVNAFEVALEGFANFLAGSEDVTDTEIRAYTQGVRKIFPELHMFEIASYVSHSEKDSFEEMMRWKGYPNFKVHGFDYKARKVIELPPQPFYYAIRFIDPETPDNAAVLGLDLASTSDVLTNTLYKALESHRPVASRPFRLLEGGKGYVIYRPAIPTAEFKTYDLKNSHIDFAMLVVRGNDLLPAWLKENEDYKVTLSYTNQSNEKIAQTLVEPTGSFSNSHMYTLSLDMPIRSESQPFRLTIEKAICIQALDWLSLTGYLLLSIFLFSYIGRRLNNAHLKKILEKHERERLYKQANYDALTGLPNTNLLMDRAEQAILRAQRSNSIVALCYMDLDRFKEINDRLGHDAGDELLKLIAERLETTLRTEDTIARIHGDEFVILLPDLSSHEALQKVEDKVLAVFSRPFMVKGERIQITCSTGTAAYPADGLNLEELLSRSDKRMYLHKHQEHQEAILSENE